MADKTYGFRTLRARMSKRRVQKVKKYIENQRYLRKKLRDYAPDILESENFLKTRQHIQHGTMTVNAHCLNVAKYSVAISRKLHIRCDEKDLVRGALLHDYFLYDWHDPGHVELYRLHGFHHPRTAWENAMKEYELTKKEQEIIRKHMWPLTIIPPTCREAWIVSMADKWCSTMETLKIHKGFGASKK